MSVCFTCVHFFRLIAHPWHLHPQTLIRKGDYVEHRCASTFGIPPWLECRVMAVEDDLYLLGDVIHSGQRWVTRESLRLVHPSHKLSFRHHMNSVMKLSRCVVM